MLLRQVINTHAPVPHGVTLDTEANCNDYDNQLFVVTYSFVEDGYGLDNMNAIRVIQTTNANTATWAFDIIKSLLNELSVERLIDVISNLDSVEDDE